MEEKKEMNIVDQALAHPIKYTFMLTKEVYSLNKRFFWGLVALTVLLALLSEIPLLGIIASVVSGILIFSVFLFTGKVFDRSLHMDMFVEEIEGINISKLWNNYWQIAFGAYLGWVLILLIIIFLTAFILGLSGQMDLLMSGDIAAQSPSTLLSLVAVPLLLFALILYLVPLVFANTIRTDTFGDAFKSVFTLFSGSVWHRAFTGVYFKYMALLGLVVIGLILVLSILFSLLLALSAIDPTLMLIGTILIVIFALVFQLLTNIFYAFSSVIADRMTQDD